MSLIEHTCICLHAVLGCLYPPPPPVRHSIWLLFLYGALDSHPFFPLHVASGCCFLSAAAAGAPAGAVSAFTEPSGWYAVLDIARCAVCTSAAPSSWNIPHSFLTGTVPVLFLLQPRVTLGAPLARCTRNATIWLLGHTRNTYFVILGASLLFDNKFLMLLPHQGYGIFGVSPNFTHFHPFPPFFTKFSRILPHVLFSRLISGWEGKGKA